ncbi:MAG: hypothetical protein AVDCRST_MAG39-1814, partial [uncultured Sphingomonadaceae bacterium]
ARGLPGLGEQLVVAGEHDRHGASVGGNGDSAL